MTTTIGNGSDTYAATIMDGYSTSRESRNVLTSVLGTNAKAVSSRGQAGLRTGKVTLVFDTWDVASDTYDLLCSGEELTLADTERPGIGMSFVTSGAIDLELDDDTRAVWIVSFDFQESD